MAEDLKPKFKYQKQITDKKISSCPPGECVACEREGFRWVKSEISEKDNFLPVALIPSPGNRGQTCLGWALSFFNSMENAKSVFKIVAPKLKENRGYTHIAQGILTETDGAMNTPSGTGHFSFFEFETVELETKFAIAGPLQ